jgi:hypothetical protein
MDSSPPDADLRLSESRLTRGGGSSLSRVLLGSEFRSAAPAGTPLQHVMREYRRCVRTVHVMTYEYIAI